MGLGELQVSDETRSKIQKVLSSATELARVVSLGAANEAQEWQGVKDAKTQDEKDAEYAKTEDLMMEFEKGLEESQAKLLQTGSAVHDGKTELKIEEVETKKRSKAEEKIEQQVKAASQAEDTTEVDENEEEQSMRRTR